MVSTFPLRLPLLIPSPPDEEVGVLAGCLAKPTNKIFIRLHQVRGDELVDLAVSPVGCPRILPGVSLESIFLIFFCQARLFLSEA